LFLPLQNPKAPRTLVMNHKIRQIRSIQTAFFILCTPESISAFSWMYIDPKRPKTAHQRMKRIASQAKRIATVVYEIRMGRIMNIRAVTAEREPTTVAKAWKVRCEQPRLLINSFRMTYPFPIAVFVLSSCFVQVLRVEANDCESEDKLQESEHEVDNVCNGEARAAAISEAHLAFGVLVVMWREREF
jgi:hypothetical protein